MHFPLGWYVAKVTCQHFLMLTWLFISTNSLVKRRTTVLSFTYWYQHVYSWHCSPYVSYFTYWENFFKHRDISYLVIISFILMICTFDQTVILLGEIRCWSLLGLKGLKRQILTQGFQEPEFSTLSHNISHFISSPDWTKQIPVSLTLLDRLAEQLFSCLPMLDHHCLLQNYYNPLGAADGSEGLTHPHSPGERMMEQEWCNL